MSSLIYPPYTHLRATFREAPLNNRRCFLRVDANVPRSATGEILEEHRLRAIFPTLDALVARNAHITIATHWERPQPSPTCMSTDSIEPLATWFANHGYGADQRITWLENIRCILDGSPRDHVWAQEMVGQFDYYINDAFGTVHHPDASLLALPELFAPHQRSIGLCMEYELRALNRLTDPVREPVVVLLGGGKQNKTELIAPLSKIAQTILLSPSFHRCLSMPAGLASYGGHVAYPIDYLIAQPTYPTIVCTEPSHDKCFKVRETNENWGGGAMPHPHESIIPSTLGRGQGACPGVARNFESCSAEPGRSRMRFYSETPVIVSAQSIDDRHPITIGPETQSRWTEIVAQAGTLIINGISGFDDIEGSYEPILELIETALAHRVTVIAGGGSTVATLHRHQLASRIPFCSTGGGALLTLLSGQKIPTLELYTAASRPT